MSSVSGIGVVWMQLMFALTGSEFREAHIEARKGGLHVGLPLLRLEHKVQGWHLRIHGVNVEVRVDRVALGCRKAVREPPEHRHVCRIEPREI